MPGHVSIVRSKIDWKDWDEKNTTPTSTKVVCALIRTMKDSNLSVETVIIHYGRGCLRLCRSWGRGVYQGRSPIENFLALVLPLQFQVRTVCADRYL